MTGQECVEKWQKVIAIYNEARQESPKATIDKVIAELGKEDTLTVFSTVARIKVRMHDGRIYGKEKDAMMVAPYVPEAVDDGTGYPMRFAGIDDIHTTHIHQLIRELIRE